MQAVYEERFFSLVRRPSRLQARSGWRWLVLRPELAATASFLTDGVEEIYIQSAAVTPALSWRGV